jgi:hypothetical protein
MKEGLEQYLNGVGQEEDYVAVTKNTVNNKGTTGQEGLRHRREIKAIFVGTRRSDPHGGKYKSDDLLYDA